MDLASAWVDRDADARAASSGLAPRGPEMIQQVGSEQERAVTGVDRAGNGERTTTRTTAPVTPMSSRLESAVWPVAGVVDVILALDFVFKHLAAANVGFVGFITGVAGSLTWISG